MFVSSLVISFGNLKPDDKYIWRKIRYINMKKWLLVDLSSVIYHLRSVIKYIEVPGDRTCYQMKLKVYWLTDKRVPGFIIFLEESLIHIVYLFQKAICWKFWQLFVKFHVMKFKSLSLPTSSLDAKLDDLLWTPSKYLQNLWTRSKHLQNLLCSFSNGNWLKTLSLTLKSQIQISEP